MADQYKLNVFTGRFDNVGDNSRAVADAIYVNVSGDTMTGDLEITDDEKGVILTDSAGGRWRVTISTNGALVTTQIISSGNTGQPMGLLLCLTYSA